MNEKLKGYRTLILTFLAALIGNIDVVAQLVQGVADIVGAQISEGGAIAALVVAVVSIKQLVTDAIPKLKGEERR